MKKSNFCSVQIMKLLPLVAAAAAATECEQISHVFILYFSPVNCSHKRKQAGEESASGVGKRLSIKLDGSQ